MKVEIIVDEDKMIYKFWVLENAIWVEKYADLPILKKFCQGIINNMMELKTIERKIEINKNPENN